MIRINLHILLAKKRLSQAELSRRTGIRQNTINDLYHEMAERISFEHIDKICETLECSISDLIEYTPKKNKPQ